MNRRLLFIVALLGLVGALAGSFFVFLGSRGADAKEAAATFVVLSAGYDPSSETPAEHLEAISKLSEESFFSRRFDDGTYLKGLSFNREAEVTEMVQVTNRKLEQYSDQEARVKVTYIITSSSPEETTKTKKEQLVTLKKITGTWKVVEVEEGYLSG